MNCFTLAACPPVLSPYSLIALVAALVLGEPMTEIPETLETILWCVALATWLMMLGAILVEVSRPHAKRIMRWLVTIGLREKKGE